MRDDFIVLAAELVDITGKKVGVRINHIDEGGGAYKLAEPLNLDEQGHQLMG
ncbi:MAG: hypothetical protein E7K64_00890 [Clostridia bacterium]|nr:hypothetical protein [Clostridiales bacterium]MDU7504588.1 hypothetical protein [Clostridia bacterium]